MPRNKRVFPFFLDGGIQTVSGTGTTAWNGTSSFVEFTGTGAKTITVGSEDEYGRPIPHGTMIVVKRTAAQTGGTTLTVNPSADFSTNDASITLSGPGDHVLLLWKAPAGSNTLGEWVELTFYNDDSDISGDLNVSGDLGVTGTLDVTGATTTRDLTVNASNAFTANGGARIVGTLKAETFLVRNLDIVDKDGDDQTLSAADLEDGLIHHTPGAANESIILPTAAIIRTKLTTVGSSMRLFVHNDDTTHDSTVEMGSGGTLVTASATATIGEGEVAEFLIRMTNVGSGTEAYDVYRL